MESTCENKPFHEGRQCLIQALGGFTRSRSKQARRSRSHPHRSPGQCLGRNLDPNQERENNLSESSFYLDEPNQEEEISMPPQARRSIPVAETFQHAMALHPTTRPEPRQREKQTVEALQLRLYDAIAALELAGAEGRAASERMNAMDSRVSAIRGRVNEAQRAFAEASASLDESAMSAALKKLKASRLELEDSTAVADALRANLPEMPDFRREHMIIDHLRKQLAEAVAERFKDAARVATEDIYHAFAIFKGNSTWPSFLNSIFPEPSRKNLGEIQQELVKKYDIGVK
jgi:hypothetical protein